MSRYTSKMMVVLALGTVAGLSTSAQASPTCTKEPKAKWISEAEMKDRIGKMGYQNIRVFKTTSGGCYEIYGFNKDGKKVEVYFNPLSGTIVEEHVQS